MRFSSLPILALPFISRLALAVGPWEAIHQTLHSYAFLIDTRQFSSLDQVFAPTATANLTGPISDLEGLPAIEAALTKTVGNLSTQHQFGTIIIDIHDDGTKTANSTIYFTVSIFGNPFTSKNIVYGYGYYADELQKGPHGWRITRREQVYQGPGLVGDLSILAP